MHKKSPPPPIIGDTAQVTVQTQTLSSIVLSEYRDVFPFSEGYATVYTHDGKMGVIDYNGNVVSEPSTYYSSISSFSEGMAQFDTYRTGIMNEEGKWVSIDLDEYASIGYLNIYGEEFLVAEGVNRTEYSIILDNFRQGYGYYSIRNNNSSYTEKTYYTMNGQGDNFLFDDGTNYHHEYREGDGHVIFEVTDEDWNTSYGVKNILGEVIIPATSEYVMLLGFSEGLCVAVNSEGIYGYIDESNTAVIPFQFGRASNFSNGYATVVTENELWGVIDKTGQLVIPTIYDLVWNYKDGFFAVTLDGKTGVINTNGETVVPCQYEDVYSAQISDGFMAIGSADGYGLFDLQGNVLLPQEYMDISIIEGTGKVLLMKDDVYSIMTLGETTTQTPTETPSTSPEIPSWAKTYTDFVAVSIMPDISGSNYNDASSRGLIAKSLYNMLGNEQDVVATHSFSDISGYETAIAWCHANGVMNGTSGTEFGTDSNVTREQFALILKQAATVLEKTTSTGSDSDLSGFGDVDSVSSWAKDGMAWAVANGLMNGSDGKLLPKGNITRTEVAVMLYNFDLL